MIFYKIKKCAALLLLLLIITVNGLDLDAVRQLSPTTLDVYPRRDATYFETDLNPKFMPLCGNGRLDNRMAYENYYANMGYNDILQVPRGRIAMTGVDSENVKLIGAKVIVDEVCDDGNRRDGDGCSADCLSLDKIDSSCEIAVNWTNTGGEILYEEIAFRDDRGGPPYVAIANGIYRLDVNSTLNLAMQPTRLASKSFPVHAMIITANDVMYMYSAQEHAVYTMPATTTTMTEQNIQKICTLPLSQNTEPGLFYMYENQLYLACKDFSSGFLIKVNETSCLVESTMSPPNRPFSLMFYVRQDSCAILLLKGILGNQNPSLMLCPGMSPIFNEGGPSNPSTSDKPWEQSMFAAFASSQIVGFQGNTFSKVILLDNSSHDISGQVDSGITTTLNTLFIYSQFYIVQTLPSIRSKYLGDNNVGGENVVFIGDPLAYSALKSSSHNYVCGRTPCMMDLHTNYNILFQNPNTKITPSDISFYTILKRLFTRSNATSWEDSKNVNETLALYESELAKNGFAPSNRKRTLTNPGTGSSWIIDGARLVEISRHGASYEVSPGKCVPASLGMCSPCQMYQAIGPCIPCGQYLNTLEWQLQCSLCSPSGGGKRLLGEQMLMVSFVLRNTNTAELKALFSQAQIDVASSNNGESSYTVRIYTSSPATVIKSIQSAAIGHANWKMDIAPRIVYSNNNIAANQRYIISENVSTDNGTNNNNNNDIPIWVWGLVGGLILLSIIICGLYYTYEQNYQRHNPKYYSR